MAEIFVGIPWGNEKLHSTTRKEHILGQMGMTPDGRLHRFGFIDGAVTAGKLLAQKAPTAAHDMDLATTAAAIGATSITVTLGATAATLNQYEDGVIYVNDVTGEGQLFAIASNPVAAASASLVLTLHEKVVTALSATSQTGLIENPYKDATVHPTTITGCASGFTNHDVPDNAYFWMCSRGNVAALIDVTITPFGEYLMRSTNVAGAVMQANYAGTAEVQNVAISNNIVAVDTDYQYCRACID
jgi:hypothetical protein